MVETLKFQRILRDDIDIGSGMREVELSNGQVVMSPQVHLGRLLLTRSATAAPTAAAARITFSELIPAGARVFGVTVKILTTFGTGNSLASLLIGDASLADRWGQAIGIVAGTVTSQTDFTAGDLPASSVARDVFVTAVGGTFTAVGLIEAKVHYMLLTHD